MTHGNYNVSDDVRPSKDGSFRSMLCVILIFFAFCAILLLAAWPWKTSSPSIAPKNKGGISDGWWGDKETTTLATAKITSNPTQKVIAAYAPNNQPKNTSTTFFEHKVEESLTTEYSNKNEEILTSSTTTERSIEQVSKNITLERITKYNVTQSPKIIVTKSPNDINAGNNDNETTESTVATETEGSSMLPLDETNRNSNIPHYQQTIVNKTTTTNSDTTTEEMYPSESSTEGSTMLPLQERNEKPHYQQTIATTTDSEITTEELNSPPTEETNRNTMNSHQAVDNETTAQFTTDEMVSSETTTEELTSEGFTTEESIAEDVSTKESVTEYSSTEESSTEGFTTENLTTESNSMLPPEEKNTVTHYKYNIINVTTTVDSEITTEETNRNTMNSHQAVVNETAQFTTDEMISSETTTEELTSEGFTTEESIVEDFSTKESVTEYSSTEKSSTEDFTTQESTTEDFPTSESIPEHVSSTEESSTEYFTTEGSSTEYFTTEESNLENSSKFLHEEESSTESDDNQLVQSNNESTETTTEFRRTVTPKIILETENTDDEMQTYGTTKLPNKNVHSFNKNMCETPDCKLTAARMLIRMNHSADPCEDFYDYACGGDALDNSPEDAWRRIADKLAEIHDGSPPYLRTFRKYYETCVDYHSSFDYEERLAKAKKIMIPLSQTPTLTDLLTTLFQHDSAPLFDISVDVDNNHNQSFVFQLTLGKQFSILHDEKELSNRQKSCLRHVKQSILTTNDMNILYDEYLECQKNYTDYFNSIKQSFKAFGIVENNDEVDIVMEHVDKIFNIFKNLPNNAFLRKDMITERKNVKRISDLYIYIPTIKWDQLLTKLVGKPVNNDDVVHVYFEDFFKTLFAHLQKMPERKLQEVLLAMYANNIYTSMVTPITKDAEDFCLHQTGNLLKEVASSMYLDSINTIDFQEAINSLNDMFINLKIELRTALNKAGWLETEFQTRNSIFKKLDNMELISRVDVWKNKDLLDLRMENVTNGNYYGYQDYAIAMVTRHRQMLYNMWNETAANPEYIWWHYQTAYSKNFVSIYPLNKIVVSPNMLISASKNVPQYITLAKIGYILAKEIGQHFDATGIKYGINMAKTAKQAYEFLASCSADKFEAPMNFIFEGKNITFQINDTLSLSLNDRISEDIAVNLISAMSTNSITGSLIPWVSHSYSREKLFFIAVAQEYCKKSSLEDFMLQLFESEHLPGPLLLKMTFGNLDLFKDTFDCAEGSNMNHPVKCPVFQELDQSEDSDY